MLRPLARPAWALGRRWPGGRASSGLRQGGCCSYTTTSGKKSDPLRILFCGSDVVSTEALQALYEECKFNRELVESIDVVVQPPKPSGRGLKKLVAVPAMQAAESMGLPYHEIPTFTGWQMPTGINLIIAVSFGLFVPPRLLKQAKYGGINVHPSFLPDLRGPAPIHHAALRGDAYVGASVQTLDATQFDHGVVLSQTPAPGLRVTRHPTLTLLTRKLAVEGAELLVQGLRDGLHVPPYHDASWKAAAADTVDEPLQHAPKITTADTEVDWNGWTPDEWARRLQLKQSVWTLGESVGPQGTSCQRRRRRRRLLFHDAVPVAADEVRGRRATMQVAKAADEAHTRLTVSVDVKKGDLYVLLPPRGDGEEEDAWIRLRRATLEGRPEKPAASAAGPFIVE